MLYRFLSASVVLALLMIASIAEALNENTTIVLHARDGFAPCDDPQQQGICVERPPTLDLTGMQMPWVYVMLRNYDQIPGFQCAFDWPPAWNYLGGAWDCAPHFIVVRQPSAPGPLLGTLALVFDCMQGGSLLTIGRMIFAAPNEAGCLSIIESSLPKGTYVFDCTLGNPTPIDSSNRGRVCLGPGGYDACSPASTPVESVTWGAIKGQYR